MSWLDDGNGPFLLSFNPVDNFPWQGILDTMAWNCNFDRKNIVMCFLLSNFMFFSPMRGFLRPLAEVIWPPELLLFMEK